MQSTDYSKWKSKIFVWVVKLNQYQYFRFDKNKFKPIRLGHAQQSQNFPFVFVIGNRQPKDILLKNVKDIQNFKTQRSSVDEFSRYWFGLGSFL